MSDLSQSQLPRLQSQRLPGLDLGEGFLYPDYAGGSILNLPASICHWLGAPGLGQAALRPELLGLTPAPLRRVILILVDALSLHRLQRWAADGSAAVWGRLAQSGSLSALTSVVPSTTSAALTSLWTGRSPAEHGVAGYEMWLKEYGIVANTILHTPISYQGDVGGLARAGFKAEETLGFPTLGTHLAAQGVMTYVLQHKSILGSGLSRMFFKDASAQGFTSYADLWVNLRQLVTERVHERQYIWVYTGEVDHFSHFYHPDDERTQAEFEAFSTGFERYFLDKLPAEARQGTLVLLTADHGQVATAKNPHYELRNHPALSRLLNILPTGEHRFMYLFVKPGRLEAVQACFNEAWPGGFAFLEPGQAVASGLFGPGAPHPRLADRLGDLIAAGREAAYLWWVDKENILVGRHGGLAAEEMIVPFLQALL